MLTPYIECFCPIRLRQFFGTQLYTPDNRFIILKFEPNYRLTLPLKLDDDAKVLQESGRSTRLPFVSLR